MDFSGRADYLNSRACATDEGRWAMTAFATQDRSALYRWGISAAIALVVHAAIVAGLLISGVVTWRIAPTPQPPGAIVVDLAPMPVSPAEQANKPAPDPAAPNPSVDKPAAPQADEKTAARSEPPKAEPKPLEEAAPSLAPKELAPTEPSGEGMPAASGGSAPAATPAARPANPIDLAIAEQRRQRFQKAAKVNDWKSAIMGRAPKSFAGHQRSPRAASLARNAIGNALPYVAGVNGMGGAERNALGVVTGAAAGGVGHPVGNAAAGTVTNAIGTTTTLHPAATGTSMSRPTIGPVASAAATPGAGLNGTTMIRRSASAGAIGGPTRTVAGVINGTGFKPKP
jgi:hypothetical protein